MIAWFFIRVHYESHKNGRNVPLALKYLIRNSSKKTLDPTILSFQQDLKFVKLMKDCVTFKNSKLLYRASENEYSASQFHKLCDGKGTTITIIESDFGNIFGGYTNIPWASQGWEVSNG